MSSRIKLTIQGLISSKTQNNTYALVLGDESRKRRITVIIGHAEAESIALQLQNIKTPRPMTHDLLLNALSGFMIELVEANIHHFEKGIFYSELLLLNQEKTLTVDARTSDAVALAIRASCPIFIDRELFEQYAISIDEEQKEAEVVPEADEAVEEEPSLEELEKRLQHSVANEQYEEAARLRDEINRKRNENNDSNQ
jgi:bifunctional DNase/RNase